MGFKKFHKKAEIKPVHPKDTPEGRARLTEIEAELIAFQPGFVRIAVLLYEVQQNRYWMFTHESWKTWLADKIGWTKEYAWQIQKSYDAMKQIESDETTKKWIFNDVNIGNSSTPNSLPACGLLKSQKQFAAIAKVPKQYRAKVLELAGKRPTEKAINFCAKQVVPKKKEKTEVAAIGELPGPVRTALASRETFEEIASKIKTLCTNWDRIIDSPVGIHVPGGQLTDQIRRIVDTIRSARPYSDCVYCLGLGGTIGDCKPCKGSGFIVESVFNSAPPEDKEKSRARK